MAASFPELTVEEQELRLESSPTTRKWTNLVQWTDKGRDRLKVPAARLPTPLVPAAVDLRDLANRSRDDAKSRLLAELKGLTVTGFEHFCRELLQQLGFGSVVVTRRSGDGGIDGYGDFRQCAVSIKSAFQAKRWSESPVGRPEIDKLRGAIQGDYDHGVFITTSRFTKEATQASYRKGAITILLLDGAALAELMIERGIGVGASAPRRGRTDRWLDPWRLDAE